MLMRISQLLVAPAFEDEEKTRTSRLLNAILLFLLVTVLVVTMAMFVLTGVPTSLEEGFIIFASMIMVLAIGGFLVLARRGHIRLTSIFLLSLMWLILSYWVLTSAGFNSDSTMLSLAIVVILAGLLLGGHGAVIFAVLSSLSLMVAYYLEISGRLVVSLREVSLMDPIFIVIQIGLIALLLRHAMNSMLDAMKRAQSNERAQIQANRELEALRASLEQRVTDRTQDLERRTVQLQAAADVSRAVTSILERERLIWEVTELICDRFNLYHVGLFELDASGQWAEYRAGSGVGGVGLAEQEFRLEVGGSSMVGWCTAHAQSRISDDVSTETERVDHPLVPQTHSEAALPLIVRGRVIGAISVQSDQPGTFDTATVATLQTIADQVAITLDNARLFTESQQALEATRRAYGELTRQAWVDLLRGRGDWGYSYVQQSVAPSEGDWQPEMLQALESGQSVQGSDSDGPVLAVPIKVRDEAVGVLSFHKEEAWTAEEAGLLEQIIQQMGLALESAQYYEETQMRAVRERTAREITARMRETLDVDAVLRIALQEMRQALGLSSMTIRLATPQDVPDGD